MDELTQRIKSAIRDVPDFPKPGIVFKDITPIFKDADLCNDIVDALAEQARDWNVNAVAGIESRGFLFGAPLAMKLGVPFVMIRKKGKLPYEKISHTYQLEYGSAEVEMHVDAISDGMNVLVHDDLLATGGTAVAASELIRSQGGHVGGYSFLVGLSFLNGEESLVQYSDNILNLVSY